ncbi:Sbal_3080 family lipoprotein [Salidesulfovibrio onnuriiensis]|uniref:Sbal_3080 family lipoprotein n=1 Tax=Salidesulfovibrio onnuriiensis TaxID=2583823 RepID=UPI0011C7A10A|nr:Sbal_3080 family lipoprotein [Salidesulfovibrio onnuriiensis]
MRLRLLFILACFFLLLPACGKMDVVHKPAAGIEDAQKLYIIKSDTTKIGFLEALESWCKKEGVRYEVLPSSANPSDHEWALTYFGRWSWDLAIFLSNAEITAFHNGKQVGQEKLIVGQWDKNKFEKGEKRIHKMMDMLYDKASHYYTSEK